MFSSFILPMEEKKDNRGEENKREKKNMIIEKRLVIVKGWKRDALRVWN